MTRRAYCRCTEVRNYDYDQAAEKLGCKRSWLEAHIADLPHQKFGQSPAFCDCELALIQGMFTVLPVGVLDLLGTHRAEEPETNQALSLKSITPSQRRRRQPVS